MHSLQAQFGKVLRERRLAVGLPQEALAEKAGLLDRGQQMPSILKIQKALDWRGDEKLFAEVEGRRRKGDQYTEWPESERTYTSCGQGWTSSLPVSPRELSGFTAYCSQLSQSGQVYKTVIR